MTFMYITGIDDCCSIVANHGVFTTLVEAKEHMKDCNLCYEWHTIDVIAPQKYDKLHESYHEVLRESFANVCEFCEVDTE